MVGNNIWTTNSQNNELTQIVSTTQEYSRTSGFHRCEHDRVTDDATNYIYVCIHMCIYHTRETCARTQNCVFAIKQRLERP